MNIDIYVDASLLQKKIGIGLLVLSNGNALLKVSKKLDSKLKISDINNAELYAICLAIETCIKASLTNCNITIYNDNSVAVLAANAKSRFKRCNDSLYDNVYTLRWDLIEDFNNKVSILKIDSKSNHDKAHEIATDAVNCIEYTEGNIFISSDNLSKSY